ncbi:hypothetical protein QTN47_25435 [Danxiaibacter flavus]|uniref:DUF4760 domain-containing protein n=1 Tax=Danxiaibacter flavus TaxID=3049108 RepID=A0ABV3ZM30_9BACT|nr:hypothetical protein QNM32_25440 [Chitinophagaceae bacterium DXS]
MLTDQEKEKIRLEETYRNEVQKLLPQKIPKKHLLWFIPAFFNSAFGLWLLSAVFLTGGIKLYDDYKAKKEDIQKTNEDIGKLNLEIGYRFSQVLVKLYDLSIDSVTKPKLNKTSKIDEVRRVALSMGNSKNIENIFLYTEYSNWSLLALLAEEKRLKDHLGKSTDYIYRVIGHISGLKVFYEVRKVDFSDIDKVAGNIQEELWLEDWKLGGFYFSEGSMNSPFP